MLKSHAFSIRSRSNPLSGNNDPRGIKPCMEDCKRTANTTNIQLTNLAARSVVSIGDNSTEDGGQFIHVAY